ncbi:glycosyltransferase family 4 protein [Aeoliella mucimassa]|uniref:Glycosyltransferase EpsD n=1 Tax=Aeoliella mucimassa TaxID=2527972 RepID=A0A518AJZ9_9BACT|nr:glycosyltransferase family 4 protein [Aeoliella mucimassa]QDU55052.1 Putative glycosyltransferase EpsD [Aeoliella mucimassa]
MNIVFLQYGDFAEAYHRLGSGGPETYRDQKHSVDFVAALAPEHVVTTISICDREHDEMASDNLRSIGLLEQQAYSTSLHGLLDSLSPDRFICRTPHKIALAWAAKHRVSTLPVFADIFKQHSLRQRWGNSRFGKLLRGSNVPFVSNHSLTASQSLQYLGLPLERINPWDWTPIPPIEPAKTASRDPKTLRVFYAGALSDAKGVGDLLEACAIAKSQDVRVNITLAGPGDVEHWYQRATQLGVREQLECLGTIPSSDVLDQMREHDAVAVPSRHSYAEGLPNTIFEALASRSPLIASDHPAYIQRLEHGESCLIFKEQDSPQLAECFKTLLHDNATYQRLSQNSASRLAELYIGMQWSELVTAYLHDDHATLQSYTLANLGT